MNDAGDDADSSFPSMSPTIEEEEIIAWKVAVTSTVLVAMLGALVSDRFGADMVLLTALTVLMASTILPVDQALRGFGNEGLWTVLVLVVVAEGIRKTGALDWYMSKWMLGSPRSLSHAQLRLMVPIAAASAFLNNTPIVAVMIPVVQKWSASIQQPVQQLMIPLSFASILGGTCTLIGTSTNLVVSGLLQDYAPEQPQIGLFDLGQYGLPVALVGLAYIVVASPWLLPGGRNSSTSSSPLACHQEDILLGARLTPWSPAAGRSVQRSGLRDTGGIFLVSVRRAATGHLHRAVSGDFVLNPGDVLYFTSGFIESFGDFCAEHGLEVMTNEVEIEQETATQKMDPLEEQEEPVPQFLADDAALDAVKEDEQDSESDGDDAKSRESAPKQSSSKAPLTPGTPKGLPREVGITKESLLAADEAERLRELSIMADLIRGYQPPNLEERNVNSAATTGANRVKQKDVSELSGRDPAKIVVTMDSRQLVVVGINAYDRPGLLLDISKGLARLHLELRHTEAKVVEDRSISIWRCDMDPATELDKLPDLDEVWTVLNALLSEDTGVQALKKRGLKVIRARVTPQSRLLNQTATQVEFRKCYEAAIVAVLPAGNRAPASSGTLSTIKFHEGDTLILQASEDSPLLCRPPPGFYESLAAAGTTSKTNSMHSLVNIITGRSKSSASLDLMDAEHNPSVSSTKPHRRINSTTASDLNEASSDIPGGEFASGAKGSEAHQDLELAGPHCLSNEETKGDILVWSDLQVLFPSNTNEDTSEDATPLREFLTAMQVAPKTKLIGRNVRQIGIQKLPNLVLVSIERPASTNDKHPSHHHHKPHLISNPSEILSAADAGSEADLMSTVTNSPIFKAIDPEEPLQEGDILWFSGPASAVGDLRKIPGLESFEREEVKKMNEKVHDRRLVQAVISRNGPLVGKTVKQVQFRTRYGAAVIAVHREGKRVHEHPGKVKLHAGDVLLLEAGPSFLAKTGQNDRSFALLAEVEDSAPPRLRMLIPALLLTVAMLVVYVAEVCSLLVSAAVVIVIMVAGGILSEQEVREAFNWEVYLTIASAFGIGIALVESGVARAIASFLVGIGTAIGIGPAGLLGAVYLATFLVSNVVTNNAAAALIFPIAMGAAEQTNTDMYLMSYAVMLGASASFMSPFGYQTNLLIYGPGGYKYTDFLMLGTPMQLILWIFSTAFLVMEPWYLSWIVSVLVIFVVVAGGPILAMILSSFRGQSKDDSDNNDVRAETSSSSSNRK